jgi:transcriptional regulator with XRE-family HTH domain
MTVKEFKIWMIVNDYTPDTLARRLGITRKTISNYVSNERFPTTFELALIGLEQLANGGEQ